MNRRAILVLLLAAAFFPARAFAEHTRYWMQTDFSDFEKGSPDGVALRSDGKLTPAPSFAVFSDPNLAFLWALRADSRGRLYAAGGSDAKVLRLDDAGKATTVFESSELAAQAIAFDSHDNLYVATSPDGKVYKVTPDGAKSVFFEPQRKYIWALAFDAAGNLFVATGDQGEVFVVGPDGKGQRFYQSHERHARSLAFDAKGNLLIGTEPDGLILRVEAVRKSGSALPAAGASFVVYETSKGEVTALAADAAGNLYAAAIGDKSRTSEAPRLTVPQTSQTQAAPGQGSGVIVSPTPGREPQPAISFGLPSSSVRGAEIVKVAPDGSPDTLWTSQSDLVYSVALLSSGKVLLGTGDSGGLIELGGDRIYSRVARAEASQITSLAVGAKGRVFLATANPGKIFVLGPGYSTSGTFTSDVWDAKIFSHWGRLSWYGANGGSGGQTRVQFYVRSGNTSNPEDNWSGWTGPYTAPAGTPVEAPAARFAQWKAVFQGTTDASMPDISWVSLAYQPKNVAPMIDDVVIEDSGVRAVSYAAQPSGPGNPAPASLRFPRGAGATSSVQIAADSSGRLDVPPQGYEQKGYQSVLWSAHDDNGDDLIFAIYYRGESERNWRLLKDKITQRFYSWDTSTMPDGAYYLKVVASDAPSNPPQMALDAERESDRWEIANTPPRIENLRAGSAAPNTKISFDATSSSGVIARAQYSVDAGEWQIVFPAGLLSDAPRESYSIELSGLAPGEHTIAVQISDRFDNSSSGKVTFMVPLRASQ